jgi:hypothetical protein
VLLGLDYLLNQALADSPGLVLGKTLPCLTRPQAEPFFLVFADDKSHNH